MHAKLVVVGGEATASEYALELPTVIGRSRSADLNLGNPLVSRQHCEIFEADGVLMVRDLGSLNGTFIGESRIANEAPLEPGDLLTIGATTFRAVYESATVPGNQVPLQPAEGSEIGLADLAEETIRPEVNQTIEASGLGPLEELREAAAESVPAASEADEEDLNFGWLEEEDAGAAAPEVEEAELEELEIVEADESAAPIEELEVEELEVVDEIEEFGNLETIEEPQEAVELEELEVFEEPQELVEADTDMEVVELEVLPMDPAPDQSAPQGGTKDGAKKPAADDDELDDFFKNLG